MVKQFFLATVVCLVGCMYTACSSTRLRQSRTTQYEELYAEQFRLTYFRLLLFKAYNNSDAVTEVISKDHSGFAEPLLSEGDYRFIDSLVSIDNQRLVSDSAESYRRAEGAGGKRPLAYIMGRLRSKWLDSVTQSRMKLNGLPQSWKE